MNIEDINLNNIDIKSAEVINFKITGYDPVKTAEFLQKITAPTLRLRILDDNAELYIAALTKSRVKLLGLYIEHGNNNLSRYLLNIPFLVSIDLMNYVGDISLFLKNAQLLQIGLMEHDTIFYAPQCNNKIVRLSIIQVPASKEFNCWLKYSNVRILTLFLGYLDDKLIESIAESKISKIILDPHVFNLITITNLIKRCKKIKIEDMKGKLLNFGNI